jgi:hypothetical protein
MSFQPASFTGVQRSGPPTTLNGSEWSIPISSQPPDEWLGFLKEESGEDTSITLKWGVNVRLVQLEFTCTPDHVPRSVAVIDRWIIRANDHYRSWLDAAQRRSSDRRRNERTEADRVHDLNERFKNL